MTRSQQKNHLPTVTPLRPVPGRPRHPGGPHGRSGGRDFDQHPGADHRDPGVRRTGRHRVLQPHPLHVHTRRTAEDHNHPRQQCRTEMPPHDGWAAKKVPGLEVAAVDRSLMAISSLTPQDDRSVEAYVAGPAALLVAKAEKLHERVMLRRGSPTGCPPRTPETSIGSWSRSCPAR